MQDPRLGQAMSLRGAAPDEAELAALKRQYGLDLPFHLQYLKWASRALTGDFGRSPIPNTRRSTL